MTLIFVNFARFIRWKRLHYPKKGVICLCESWNRWKTCHDGELSDLHLHNTKLNQDQI